MGTNALSQEEALSTAIYNEKLSRDRYANLAAACKKSGNETAAGFFEVQSKREQGHYNRLSKQRDRLFPDSKSELGTVVKWVTPETGAGMEDPVNLDLDGALALVEQAEQATEVFYRTQAEAATDGDLAALFARLAEEEAHHAYLAHKIRAKLEMEEKIEPIDYSDLGYGN